MKLTKKLLAALIAGGFSVGTASADPDGLWGHDEDPGWYVSGAGGANWLDDQDLTPTGGSYVAGVSSHNVDYTTGWGVAGAVGYHFLSNWRIEGELGYRQNELDFVGLSLPLGAEDGEFSNFSQMINILYDHPLNNRLSVSLGGGLGGSQVDGDITFPGVIASDVDEYKLAYQGIAGMGWKFNEHAQMMLEYRYFATDDVESTNSLPGIGLDDVQNSSHSVFAGLRWYLNPPAHGAPEVGCDQKNYTVFFDFDKSNLTTEAQQVIGTAVGDAGETGCMNFDVVGHTDTVGSAAYNDALSLRRAQSVQDELVRLGVSGSDISISGRGFSEPLVQTGPGVREPQNRRAEITIR